MIHLIDTRDGKIPYIVAQVIRPSHLTVLFKVYPFDTPLNLDLESLYYEKDQFEDLIERDSFVLMNTECSASKDCERADDDGKGFEFNESGSITSFKGKVIDDSKDNFWIDANVPIRFADATQRENLPAMGESIQKKTSTLRVKSILLIENPEEFKDEIEKLKELKIKEVKVKNNMHF